MDNDITLKCLFFSVYSQCPLTVVNQWGVFGDPDITPGALFSPSGITFDPNGDLWISESNRNWIQSFDVNGNYLRRLSTDDGNWDIGKYLNIPDLYVKDFQL